MAAHCAMPTDETIIATETSRSSFGRFCRNFSVKRFVSSCHFSSNRIWENRRVLQKYLSIGLRLKMDYYVSNVILSKLKTRSANVKKCWNDRNPFFGNLHCSVLFLFRWKSTSYECVRGFPISPEFILRKRSRKSIHFFAFILATEISIPLSRCIQIHLLRLLQSAGNNEGSETTI